MNKKSNLAVVFLLTVTVLAGIGTGWGSARLFAPQKLLLVSNNNSASIQQVADGKIKDGDVFGVADDATYQQTAEGFLEEGGIDTEGTHKLLRVGGPSQTVYLTSSNTDLDKFVGMEIKVWGETFKGQKAGWLMDVGKVRVLKVAGQAPVED